MQIQNLKNTNSSPPSLKEQVFRELRSAVITGKFPSGSRLIEATLADNMGVSRTPVREALHRLTQEGLLNAIPRAGYIVQDMSDYDIQDLFRTRTAMEQLAAKWALESITEEEILSLERNLKKNEEIIKTGETEKMAQLDTEFHQVIYRASRSKRLYQMCQTLNDHTLRFRLNVSYKPEVAQRTWNGHAKIVAAIKSGDPQKVDEAIQFHLDTAKKTILDNLYKERQASFIVEGSPF